jgi:hypothetical protein
MNTKNHYFALAAFAGSTLLAAPAHAGQTAVDLFQSDFFPFYQNGNIVGQTVPDPAPAPFEAFAGMPAAGPGLVGPWAGVEAVVDTSGSGTVTATTGTGRTGVAVNPWPEYSGTPGALGGTTFYFRARVALGTGGGFQALELADSAAGASNLIQLVGGAGLAVGSWNGTAYTGTVGAGTNDGGYHEWLIALDTATGAGTVWLDGVTPNATTPALPWAGNFNPAVGGMAFTAAPGFKLGGINLASFAASSVSLDYVFISADGGGGGGPSWEDVGLTVVSGPSGTFAGWIGGFDLDPADQDFTDDPDGDGLDNGVEAFFGTNPAVANAGLSQISKSGNLFTFQHPEADPALGDVRHAGCDRSWSRSGRTHRPGQMPWPEDGR